MNKKMSSPCGNVKKNLGNEDGRSIVCVLPSPKYLPLPIFLKNRDRCTLSKRFLIVFITP